MRFAIVGVGGVGGYVGARLAQAGHEVAFVARGEHLAAIQRDGLHVVSPQGDVSIAPARATADAGQIGPVDCVILAVKTWQVAEAARASRPLAAAHTLVLPLQNGVEAPERVAEVFGPERALGGVAKIMSYVSGPGRIHHAGVDPALVVGTLDRRADARVDALLAAFAGARGLSVTLSDDIQRALWEKFLFITAWAGVGAVTRAPMGVVRSVPLTRALLEGALGELEQVGRARGVPLAPGVFASTLAFIESVPADGTASMQRDIAAGRPSELDDLTGGVVRLGARLGVATPVNTFLLAALTPLEQRARGQLAF